MMKIQITKEDFENAVCVATSAQVEVFDKLQPAIKTSTQNCEDMIIGQPGKAKVDAQDSDYITAVKNYICLDAFIHQLRELDLVLTPTGFGVVANNTTSPASKARVDALENSLMLNREIAYSKLLEMCRNIEGWGDTHQAAINIKSPFYSIIFVNGYPSMEDFKQYRAMEKIIYDADLFLRKLIGHKQYEEILSYIRNKSADVVYCDVARLMREYIRMRYWDSPVIDDKVRYIISFIEGNAEKFKSYMESEEYKANHHEGFKNTKDKKGYFFVG